jgi:hypothetical protein
MLTTGGLWSYFRFRPRPAEEATESRTDSGASTGA